MDYKKFNESLDSILKEHLDQEVDSLNGLSKEEIKDLIQGTDPSDEDRYLVLDSEILDKVYNYIQALSNIGFVIEYYDSDRSDGNYEKPYDVVILNIQSFHLEGSIRIGKKVELNIDSRTSITETDVEEIGTILTELSDAIYELK